MALNEAMLANLTAEELAHYAAFAPDLMATVKPVTFMEAIAEEMMELKDEVSGLESELRDKEDVRELDYYAWERAEGSVKEVLEGLGEYCQDLADDHPLVKIFRQLEDASVNVNNLIHG